VPIRCQATNSSIFPYSTKRLDNRSTRRTGLTRGWTITRVNPWHRVLRDDGDLSKQQGQSLELENVGVDRPDLFGRLYGDIQRHRHVTAAGRGPDRIVQV
jgi:hypothetical protein